MSKDTIMTMTDPGRSQRSDRLLVLLIVSTMLVAGSNIVMYHRMFMVTELDTFIKPHQPRSYSTLYNATPKNPFDSSSQQKVRETQKSEKQTFSVSNSSNLAALHCDKYGGPDDTFATQEMVYWSDIPNDTAFKSPFYNPDKYLTFEPDQGNNALGSLPVYQDIYFYLIRSFEIGLTFDLFPL